MDFYMDGDNVADRLVEEWRKYGRLIVAYDCDNTVFNYRGAQGRTFGQVIELLRECKELGAYLMVYTACDEKKFDQIEQYLNDNRIPFDAINEQPAYIAFSGKKLYYNILLDDRAGLSSAYLSLKRAVETMKADNKKTQVIEVPISDEMKKELTKNLDIAKELEKEADFAPLLSMLFAIDHEESGNLPQRLTREKRIFELNGGQSKSSARYVNLKVGYPGTHYSFTYGTIRCDKSYDFPVTVTSGSDFKAVCKNRTEFSEKLNLLIQARQQEFNNIVDNFKTIED